MNLEKLEDSMPFVIAILLAILLVLWVAGVL